MSREDWSWRVCRPEECVRAPLVDRYLHVGDSLLNSCLWPKCVCVCIAGHLTVVWIRVVDTPPVEAEPVNHSNNIICWGCFITDLSVTVTVQCSFINLIIKSRLNYKIICKKQFLVVLFDSWWQSYSITAGMRLPSCEIYWPWIFIYISVPLCLTLSWLLIGGFHSPDSL